MRNKSLGTEQPGFHPIRKMLVACKGLRYAVLFDFAVVHKPFLSLGILAVCFIYRQWLDFGLVLLATGLMLIAEMFNTAIEALCDYVEPKYDARVGIIKDISASATGMIIFVWFSVMVLEVYGGINSFL